MMPVTCYQVDIGPLFENINSVEKQGFTSLKTLQLLLQWACGLVISLTIKYISEVYGGILSYPFIP